MAKFSTVAFTVAGAATVILVGIASTATAATLQTFTSTSSTFLTDTSSPSITPSPSPSITPSPSSDPNTITADIYVALGFPDDDGPMAFQVSGVVVGDGVELTGADQTTNPEDYCGDATVDVSLNPTTITVTGGEEYCDFQEAYVEVTLHGVEFGSVTLNSDNLFEPFGDRSPALGLSGGSYKARGVHAVIQEGSAPTLQSYGVSGSTFSAYWYGENSGDMSGASVFTWVPLARAGSGVAAAASFAG